MQIDPADLISPANYAARGIPYEQWAQLRNEPLQHMETAGFEDFWPVTRHADIMAISRDPERFSNAEGGIVVYNDEQRADRGSSQLSQMKTIIEMDPPDHRIFRKVASSYFTPRGIERLDEIVVESAVEVLDSLGGEGEADFVEKVAQRHPLRVLCTILGVPRDQEDRLLELTAQLLGSDDPDLQREGEDRKEASRELGIEFFDMFNAIIEDRRANPTSDLATMLATATFDDGEPMGLIETLGYYLIVFNAGHDTTRHSLSSAFEAFVDHPDEFRRMKENPSLVTTAVEEVVRWSAPVNYMKRTVVADTVFESDGFEPVELKAGERLALFYAAANRDERVFENANTFDVSRNPNRHLGFGWAEHYCLGAHLARASITALLEQMAKRVEVLERAGEPTNVASSFILRPQDTSNPVQDLGVVRAAERRAVLFGGGVELLHERFRGGNAVRVFENGVDLVPVDFAVESHSYPPTVTNVGRHEEPLRFGFDQLRLHPGRRSTPDRKLAVAVMIFEQMAQHLLVTNEQRGRHVRRSRRHLGEPSADLFELAQTLVRLRRFDAH